MTVWNDKMAGRQTASGQVSVNLAFTLNLLFCNAYQFCSSNVWIRQHHPVPDFYMSTIIVFVYLGLQFEWTPFSSNLICWATNQMLSVHWDSIGLHRNYTGWCYHSVVFQWQSSGNLHNWNTLEDHWSYKYIGCHRPTLADWSTQWCPSGNPVLIGIFETHWKAIGRPLEAHWKHTGHQHFFLQRHFSAH